jgi:phosphoribosylformylglycinamidine synthase subunit PurQ / glutaminase
LRIAVVTFPGSNCDEDAVHVLRNVLAIDAVKVWHRDPALPAGTDGVILPGGFSYGDALRSGALARFSPIMGAVKAHAEKGGLVLGICNGMQILVESGLLPGAMLQNASTKFVCRWVEIEVQSTDTPFTSRYQKGQKLRIPVAHHEGRYFAPPEVIAQLKSQDRIAFRYAKNDNPNGATDDIAGLTNEAKNVLGMMPHPERASEALLGSEDGKALFLAMVESAAGRAA